MLELKSQSHADPGDPLISTGTTGDTFLYDQTAYQFGRHLRRSFRQSATTPAELASPLSRLEHVPPSLPTPTPACNSGAVTAGGERQLPPAILAMLRAAE